MGLGGEAAYPRAISVEELLVVTFTEAATEELRGRIRSNIHELRIACLRGESDNPLYSALLAEIADKDDAAKTLLLAERQMDEAAVFTIHGFCQRMLSLNAFESGMLFEQQLIEDESACAIRPAPISGAATAIPDPRYRGGDPRRLERAARSAEVP